MALGNRDDPSGSVMSNSLQMSGSSGSLAGGVRFPRLRGREPGKERLLLILGMDSSKRILSAFGTVWIQEISNLSIIQIREGNSNALQLKMQLLHSTQITQQIARIRRFPSCLGHMFP